MNILKIIIDFLYREKYQILLIIWQVIYSVTLFYGTIIFLFLFDLFVLHGYFMFNIQYYIDLIFHKGAYISNLIQNMLDTSILSRPEYSEIANKFTPSRINDSTCHLKIYTLEELERYIDDIEEQEKIIDYFIKKYEEAQPTETSKWIRAISCSLLVIVIELIAWSGKGDGDGGSDFDF